LKDADVEEFLTYAFGAYPGAKEIFHLLDPIANSILRQDDTQSGIDMNKIADRIDQYLNTQSATSEDIPYAWQQQPIKLSVRQGRWTHREDLLLSNCAVILVEWLKPNRTARISLMQAI
jgi:hypothetical protein